MYIYINDGTKNFIGNTDLKKKSLTISFFWDEFERGTLELCGWKHNAK